MMEEFVKKYYTPNNVAFSRLATGFLLSMGNVFSHRMVVSLGGSQAELGYRHYFSEVIDKMRPGREYEKYVVFPNDFFRTGQDEMMLNKAVESAISNARRMTDAASIVFAHSILDAFSGDLLTLGIQLDESRYFRFISERRIKVSEVLAGEPSALDAERVRDWLTIKVKELVENELKRESLCKKIDCLHSICKPESEFLKGGDFRYDRSRLQKVDKKRHNIVHGLDFASNLDSIAEDLDYIMSTGVYLTFMVAMGFNLKILPFVRPDSADTDDPGSA